MEPKINLLIISPNFSLYEAVTRTPVPEKYNVLFCQADDDMFSLIKEHAVRVSLIELLEPGREALSLIKKLKKFDPLLDIILLGDPLEPDAVLDWIHQGATDYISKPLQKSTVQEVLQRIMEKRELRRETFQLERKLEHKYIFQDMISRSPYMQEVFSLIENNSKYSTSVLITGETGTGKEMVARAIHRLSPCRQKALVVCDCASIPESLFESELFGYKKGAFTGADKDKKGLFEEAREGVIFLDEIGEIPPAIQAKMLRVLETHEFRPLGSSESRQVNVRVIAATNRNLAELLGKNLFREDLYHRLNKVEIHIPPLRERLEDIPLLARHFLQGLNKKFSKNLKGISREVQKIFLKYGWPGNVRELKNVLESASLLCRKEFIEPANLPKYLRDFMPTRGQARFINRENLVTLDGLEKDYIAYLLKVTRNNLKQAAKILGISRTTLYNKLKRHGLSR
jgi:DNA-binding NtrC family response regulator